MSFPDALARATATLSGVLDGPAFDVLAATPLAGLPIGTALCLDMDRPLIYPRKTARLWHGQNIEGRWAIGQTAVVIDDLITSGDSLLETFATVKAAGLKVSELSCSSTANRAAGPCWPSKATTSMPWRPSASCWASSGERSPQPIPTRRGALVAQSQVK